MKIQISVRAEIQKDMKEITGTIESKYGEKLVCATFGVQSEWGLLKVWLEAPCNGSTVELSPPEEFAEELRKHPSPLAGELVEVVQKLVPLFLRNLLGEYAEIAWEERRHGWAHAPLCARRVEFGFEIELSPPDACHDGLVEIADLL